MIEKCSSFCYFFLFDKTDCLVRCLMIYEIDAFKPICDLSHFFFLIIIDSSHKLFSRCAIVLDECILFIDVVQAKLCLILKAVIQIFFALICFLHQIVQIILQDLHWKILTLALFFSRLSATQTLSCNLSLRRWTSSCLSFCSSLSASSTCSHLLSIQSNLWSLVYLRSCKACISKSIIILWNAGFAIFNKFVRLYAPTLIASPEFLELTQFL